MSKMDDPGDSEADAIETEPVEPTEPERGEIKYAASMSLAEATSYFESIVAGMRAGHMRVSHEEMTLTLEPQDPVEVSVKAVRKKGKEKISFEVEWRLAPQSGLRIESE